MLQLSNQDRQQLRTALTSGFTTYNKLKIFVSDHFDFRLDSIAESRATEVASDNLIEHCKEVGEEIELILALQKERPRNLEVQKLLQRLSDFFEQRLLLEPNTLMGEDVSFELSPIYDELELESFLPQSLSYETDVGKLKRGLEFANSVCRISFPDRKTTGTGVLIAPDLILTNYHVLSKETLDEKLLTEKAKTILFEFGFISEEHSNPIRPDTFSINTSELIVSASPISKLDYALLRVESSIKNSDYIKPISIGKITSELQSHDPLTMLQHPTGDVMQISLSASGVVKVDKARDRVWYVNRTDNGSSGSPCFNENWELVALHHASMSRGFGSIREGILISSILLEIQQFL